MKLFLALTWAMIPFVVQAVQYTMQRSKVTGKISEAQALTMEKTWASWNLDRLKAHRELDEGHCLPLCLLHEGYELKGMPLYMNLVSAEYAEHIIVRHKRLSGHEHSAVWCVLGR